MTKTKTKTMPKTRLRLTRWPCDYMIRDLAVADLSVVVGN